MDTEQAKTVADKIARQFGCSFEDLCEKTNVMRKVNARNYAYIILHRRYGVSLNGLAAMFGRTNREICYRIAKMDDILAKNPAARRRYDHIIERLE